MTRRLSASQAKFYRQLVRDLPVGMAVLHLGEPRDVATWEVVASNSKASLVAGSTVADYLALPIPGKSSLSGSPNLPDLYRQTLSRKRPRRLGHMRTDTQPTPGGPFLVTACPLPSNCVGVVFQDETLLRQAARELVEVETQLLHMCETARAILWRANPVTLEFTSVNPQARQILGYWVERWCRESSFWRNHVHADDWPIVEAGCREAVAQGGTTQFDCRMFSVHGGVHWFRVYVKRVYVHATRTELAGVMVDITDQKETEQAARDLSARVIRAQEQERKRISRELHDSIGQYLTAVNFTLGGLRQKDAFDAGTRQKLKECVELVQTCMHEIRSVSYMLHPPLVDLLGLAPALRSYAENFSRRTGIHVELDLPEESDRLAADAEIAFFRMVQECLTNVERHARSKSARATR
jgi:PAS domain S-box-containing protein